MRKNYLYLLLFTLSSTVLCFSQQDSQYTQYMYNPQIINPAYAGSKSTINAAGLYRTQWVGFEGAPKTGTFTINTPIGVLENMGLGLSVFRDEVGPAIESNITIDYAYAIETSDKGKLSFGVKGGLDILDVDFSILNIFDVTDPRAQNNVDNKLQPQIGAGLYYYTEKFYAGLSVPNFLPTKHFNEETIINSGLESIAAERLHYFFITGYVFDLTDKLKFKPATLVKAVNGSPLQFDVSANFLISDALTLGAAYRWDAAISAIAGFQVNNSIFIGFGYDYQTTDIQKYSNGSYEAILRFDISIKSERILTPRFF